MGAHSSVGPPDCHRMVPGKADGATEEVEAPHKRGGDEASEEVVHVWGCRWGGAGLMASDERGRRPEIIQVGVRLLGPWEARRQRVMMAALVKEAIAKEEEKGTTVGSRYKRNRSRQAQQGLNNRFKTGNGGYASDLRRESYFTSSIMS